MSLRRSRNVSFSGCCGGNGNPVSGNLSDDHNKQARRNEPAKRLRAGEAFLEAIERDPAAQAGLRRVQGRLRAIAEAFQSLEQEQSRKSQQAAMAQLAEQVRQALRDTGDELAACGLPTPTTPPSSGLPRKLASSIAAPPTQTGSPARSNRSTTW